jgi:translocation protein SEC66
MNQANAFNPAWGQTIFQSANEIAQNTLLRKRVAEIQSQKDTEKTWWENRKKTIQADLLAELDESSVVETKAPSRTSDDDTVLVEGGGPVDTKGQSGVGGKGKKKKGKH